MARRLPNSSQLSKRDQYHSDAVSTAHARELRSTLAEKSSARIHQLLEPVPRSLHRKLQITYKRPASLEELRACKQGTREALRAYIQRWMILKNSAEDISDESMIDAFRRGL